MKLHLAIFFTFFIFFSALSQNVTIKGKAHPSHIGKEIVLSNYSDYITYQKVKESSDTIDKNGYFELKYEAKYTQPLYVSIDNLIGKLYVQPDFVYGIYFPEKDSLANNQEGTESTVNISVYGKDSTELNALMIDFNIQYNKAFTKAATTYLPPVKMNALLDTFLVASRKRYKTIKNTYFKNYINYSFANFYSNTSRSKQLLYKQFIEKKPILYTNYEYMEFFNTYYKGYLASLASTQKGGSIFNSINNFADYTDLKKQVAADKTITNDTLRELIILKGLADCYYDPDFDKHQVTSVIEQYYRETTILEHKKIALNLLQKIYELQPGANAPDFIANDKTGKQVNLSYYKGKYIYLNFFSTESEVSLREMQKIVDLKKKFNDKIVFVSVCLDDSVKKYNAYLKQNLKQNWIILHQAKNSTAKQAYNIKTLSGFFFINPQMQLMQSPALAPSEGVEYKFNALFKPKKKNTIPGIR